MAARPRVVAFDIVETTFSLETLRPRLAVHGIPGACLETWFARILRDAFALAATDTYAGFRDIASATLAEVAREHGRDLGKAGLDAVLDGFGQLDPHPDAAEAFRILRSADVRVAALSNGAAETTQALLQRGGLSPLVERVISVTEIREWKPRRGLYLHAAAVLEVQPAELALVATHAWDVHGAKCAGLFTGFVARGQSFPGTMATPDIVGQSLVDVASGIAALSAG
ncbi:MAG: haloacid dehalogenase type II [Acetobacteraceae bacterium]